MKSRHLVDPELLPLLDSVPAIDFSADLLPAVRSMPLVLTDFGDHRAATEMVRRTIAGPAGAPELEVAIYTPRAAGTGRACILHIHGGGYVTGSFAPQEGQHRQMADVLQCAVVSVNYRLAPETRFPGAIEDCYATLRWIVAHAAELGIDAKAVGVMGESAGGGLAASLALLARDRGEYPLAFQHLIYPMLDDRTATSVERGAFAGEYFWSAASNRFGWQSLLGEVKGGTVSPYAAAARAETLEGLPRTFLSTGALDLFVEENLEYARRLLRAGVPVELHVYPGAIHGFDILTNTEVAKTSRRDSLAALGRFTKPAQR